MSIEPVPKRKFTPDEVFNYDLAKNSINQLKGFWSRELQKEREKDLPDQERMDALKKFVRTLHDEHACFDLGDKELENKAKYVYAPILKALMNCD